MRVAFHTNQICLQGTEVALFDYAHFNEEYFGNTSIVISKKNRLSARGGAGKNQPLALKKFNERFKVILYNDKSELENILKANNVDVLYAIKKGIRDGIESKSVKTCVHTVFKYYEPHGQVYAYISKWLSDQMTSGQAPYVPHMIYLPKVQSNLRAELNLPSDAVVFGRYGGSNSFDVPFAPEVILNFVKKNPKAYFIFMNTDDFLNPGANFIHNIKKYFYQKTHKQIIFLPATSLLERKSQFINTCTAMLHARLRGETFGIAIGEFSIHNVPVITYDGTSDPKFESNHLNILGEKCFKYRDASELADVLAHIVKEPAALQLKNWDAYSAEYSSAVVMRKFKDVFLS